MTNKRLTKQKLEILRIVRASRQHVTAQEVWQAARMKLPSISLATVYRNLEQLAKEGVVQKIILSDLYARYDNNTGQHYHIRCENCGRVDDLPLSFNRTLESRVAESVGYKVLGHYLEVVGLCPACKEERRLHKTI